MSANGRFFFLFYFTDSKVGKTLIDNTFLN